MYPKNQLLKIAFRNDKQLPHAFHRTSRSLGSFVSVAMLLLAATVPVALGQTSPPMYSITNLGELGMTHANDINNRGEVVGGNGQHALLYSGGKMIDLGTLGGTWSEAYAINDNGQVIGSSEYAVGYRYPHAFIYSSGQMKDLGTLGGIDTSYAYGINDAGQIVGMSSWPSGFTAFLHSAGTMWGVWPLSYGCYAVDINNDGQMLINVTAPFFDACYIYSGGTNASTGGVLTGVTAVGDYRNGTDGAAINDKGKVVGMSSGHAFIYSNGVTTDLGPGAASGINNNGQVVGRSTVGVPHGFLYSEGAMTDISLTPDLAVTRLEWDTVPGVLKFSYSMSRVSSYTSSSWSPIAINDKGQILCSNGTLLTPVTPSSTSAHLFWANGADISNKLSNIPFFAHAIPAGFIGDSGLIQVSASNMRDRPTNATHILLVLNPDNQIPEIDKANNIASLNYVCFKPAITNQPLNQSNIIGSSVAFSVGAVGTESLSYQWRHQGTNLLNGGRFFGATSPTLNIANIQTSDIGSYSAIVSNDCGTANSFAATLTITYKPIITDQPRSQTNLVGSSIAFSVGASGTAPLSYQWRHRGTNLLNAGRIFGANSATLNISNIQTNDAGNYDVIVSNDYGATNSSIVTLAVHSKPIITDQPRGQTNIIGASVTFSVGASGTEPLSYQWRHQGTNVLNGGRFSGANSATLNIANIQTDDIGNYDVTVSNDYGFTNSSNAILAITSKPVITEQPRSQTNIVGNDVTFTVGVVGTPSLGYQWRYNGNLLVNAGSISGATASTLHLTNIQIFDAGAFDVIVTNSYGSVTSQVARLTVAIPPQVTSGPTPASGTYVEGTYASVSFGLKGTPPLTYIWRLDGVPTFDSQELVNTEFVSSMVFSNVQPSQAGHYDIILINDYGAVTSQVATVTVLTKPAITNQPVIQTNFLGDTVSFTVNANGTDPLSYQWQHQGTNLLNGGRFSGVNSATLNIADVRTNDAGNYDVIVSNAYGSTKGLIATLAIAMKPAITNQPQNMTKAIGATATFAVSANGTPVLNYQWLKNGTNLLNSGNIYGATSSLLTLTNLQLSDAGDYTVVVTNSYGSVTSSVATLIVGRPPEISAQPLDRTNHVGTKTTFSVTATGFTTPMHIIWRKNGTPFSDGGIYPGDDVAYQSILTLANVQLSNAGGYDAIVTNNYGSVTSRVASLTVKENNENTSNLADGLLLWLPFDGDALDASGNGRHGIVHGAGLTTNRFGEANSAYVFNGSDYIQVDDLDPDHYTNGFSFGAWIRPDTSSGVMGWSYDDGWGSTYIYVGNSGINFRVGTGSSATDHGSVAASVPFHAWSHVFVTHSPTNDSLYVNGQLIGQWPSYSMRGNVATFLIGSCYAGNFVGAIDDVVVYGREILPDEVQALYAGMQPDDMSFPRIIAQPTDLIVSPGGGASFNVQVFGSSPFSYQWRKDGTNLIDGGNISGATTTNLSLANAQFSDAGDYVLIVTNLYGSATSHVALLTVSLLVNGSFENGINPPINDFALLYAGNTSITGWIVNYGTIAWGGTPWNPQDGQLSAHILYHGSSISQTLDTVPGQAYNVSFYLQTPYANSSPVTEVTLDGDLYYPAIIPPGPAYNWYRYTTTLRATGAVSTLTFKNASGGYSSSFIDNVSVSPSTHPVGVLKIGNIIATATSELAATGRYASNAVNGIKLDGWFWETTDRSYQAMPWDGDPAITFDLQNAYQLDHFLIWNSHEYGPGIKRMNVEYSLDGQTFNLLNEFAMAPGTGTQIPSDTIELSGITARYVRFHILENYSGQTFPFEGDNFTHSPLVAIDEVEFYGMQNLLVGPAISTQPTSQTNVIGGTAMFSVIATGTAPLSYQWLHEGTKLLNGGNVSGATSNILTLANLQLIDAGSYSVVITNNSGSITSSVASLTIIVPPQITLQPQSRTVTEGSNVTFTVAADSSVATTYQWRRNGAVLDGQTSSTLQLNNVTTNNSGVYTVTVSNIAGTVTSDPALLTVLQNIILPGVSVTVSPTNILKSGGLATLRFQRTDATNSALSVAYSVSGTAVANTDFTLAASPVNIPAGALFAEMPVYIINRSAPQAAKTVIVTVLTGATYTSTNPVSATLWITDDEVSDERVMRVGRASGQTGSAVSVPVELLAIGDENSASFSLTFDTRVLSYSNVTLGADALGGLAVVNTNQAGAGRIGIAVALPPGQKFSEGVRQLAALTVNILSTATNSETKIVFGDEPIGRDIVNAAAQQLPAFYMDGILTIVHGYEADVAPRPNGKGTGKLTLADWVQVGRFYAQLDTNFFAGEFQRADCAPRATSGDGRLTLADWVQAGRYFAQLDTPVSAAAGPVAQVAEAFAMRPSAEQANEIATVEMRLHGNTFVVTKTNSAMVQLVSHGEVNAAAASISYPANLLRFTGAILGVGAPSAFLQLNTNTLGQIGFAIAVAPGSTFAAGTNSILELQFTGVSDGSGTLRFRDSPVLRELVNADGLLLPTSYDQTDGSIAVSGSIPAQLSSPLANGNSFSFELVAEPGSQFAIQTSTNLTHWNTVRVVTIPTSGRTNILEGITPGLRQTFYRGVQQ